MKDSGDRPHDDVTGRIIGAAIRVHRELGPGLLESSYEACLARELEESGISFRRQIPLPVEYKGVRLDAGYQIDLLVEERIVVELKSTERLTPLHEAQLLTYLRLSRHRVGLLINFNVRLLKDGIIRRIL